MRCGSTPRVDSQWLPMRYIDFLPSVYEIAATFSSRRKGRSNVYLVLLDFADRRRGPFGLYVGMSRYTPAERFDQHKAGIHAAGSVLKRGLEVLTGPTLHLQRIARAEAAHIEADSRRPWGMRGCWSRAATRRLLPKALPARAFGPPARVRVRLATPPALARRPDVSRPSFLALAAAVWTLLARLTAPGAWAAPRPHSCHCPLAPASAWSMCSTRRSRIFTARGACRTVSSRPIR